MARVETLFQISDIFFIMFFDEKLSCFLTFTEDSFKSQMKIPNDLNPMPIFLGVKELPIVNFILIKIEKAFIFLVLWNRMPKIYAVFELFYQGRSYVNLR